MPFKKRREFVFLYTIKDVNPNGNPLEENHPRWDEDTERFIRCVKRTIVMNNRKVNVLLMVKTY